MTQTDLHADCHPEALATEGACRECLAPQGQQCQPTCSTWSNILHVCQEPR